MIQDEEYTKCEIRSFDETTMKVCDQDVDAFYIASFASLTSALAARSQHNDSVSRRLLVSQATVLEARGVPVRHQVKQHPLLRPE